MVKVRHSQIPEEDGKPVKTRFHRGQSKSKASTNKHVSDEDEDDEENSSDNFFGKKSDDGEEKTYIKTIVHFPDFGFSMSLWDIDTIDKDMRFVEKPKARWQYGITINKGMEPSMRFPIVEKSIWFEYEDTRDKRYDQIMEILQEKGVKVITL